MGLSPRSLARYRLAAGAWAVFIAIVLLTVAPLEPSARWGWIAALAAAGGDKLGHAALFAVEAWLVVRCRGAGPSLGWLVVAFLAVTIYGAVTEAVQLAVPGRDGTFGDFLADAAGAAAGAGWHLRRVLAAGARR